MDYLVEIEKIESVKQFALALMNKGPNDTARYLYNECNKAISYLLDLREKEQLAERCSSAQRSCSRR